MLVSAGPHDRVVCLPLCPSSLGGARVAGWRAIDLCWEGTWWWAMALPGTCWPWLPLLPTCFESPESAARRGGATSPPPLGGGGTWAGHPLQFCWAPDSQPRGNNRHLLGPPPVVHKHPVAQGGPPQGTECSESKSLLFTAGLAICSYQGGGTPSTHHEPRCN